MSARIFVPLVFFACLATLSHSEDMRKVPPMTYEGSADVELKGRELEAIEVALRQFRKAEFPTSRALKHFTIELRRRDENLAVSFFPEYDEASSHGLPARNKYGMYITYFVSLQTLKIVGYTFERD